MTDPRHPPDTLFIVLEEDFRIYREGGVAATAEESRQRGFPTEEEDEVIPREDQIYLEYADRLHRMPLVKQTPLSGEPVASDGGSEEVGHGFYVRTAKPKPIDFEGMTEELPDIVKMCTKAHRLGRGGLVWFGWNGGLGRSKKGHGGGQRQAHPYFGSQGIAGSVAGANGLKRVWDGSIARGHFDVSLLKALMSDDIARAAVPACFVWPAVGHFRTHHSSILSDVRQANWDLPCVQEGTRPFREGMALHTPRLLPEWVSTGTWEGDTPRRR